jgi:ABC-type nitrate/sulfonate/bicarbonate transport system substrate-binding protein
VAIEKGYFAEQGLEAELHTFRSGALTIAPLSMGQLDVGQGDAMGAPLLNAIHQGLPVRVVAGAARHTKKANSVHIVVRKDLFDSGEVTEPADLKGRKVAINKPGNVICYWTLAKIALTTKKTVVC